MSLTLRSGVLRHYCNVQVGESIDFPHRENIRINLNDADNAELYAGRVFYIDDDGLGKKGVPTNPDVPLYIAHRGVEAMDIQPTAPGGVGSGLYSIPANGTHGGSATVAGIPLREGLKIDTTEYDSDQTYELNDRVYVTTAGIFTTENPTNTIAVGYVATEHPTDGVAGAEEDYDGYDVRSEITRRMDLDILTVRITNIVRQ